MLILKKRQITLFFFNEKCWKNLTKSRNDFIQYLKIKLVSTLENDSNWVKVILSALSGEGRKILRFARMTFRNELSFRNKMKLLSVQRNGRQFENIHKNTQIFPSTNIWPVSYLANWLQSINFNFEIEFKS